MNKMLSLLILVLVCCGFLVETRGAIIIQGGVIINGRLDANGQVVAPTNSVPPRPAIAGGNKDVVLFRNGDVLIGSLDTIDAQKNVRWRHPDAAQPIDFLSSNIVQIVLRDRPPQKTSTSNLCAVTLSDDEELEGNLVSCDADKLILQTWYGGTISIPRKLVQNIEPSEEARPAVFYGPTSMEGWTSAKSALAQQDYGQWHYKDGAFYATKAASIARDLKLPDVASIQFDVAWKGTFHMAIALYTDSLLPVSLANKEAEPDFGGFYSLQLNNYFACDCLSIKKRDPLKYLGQVTVPAFNQKNNAHIELRVSKPKRFIAMFVDGNFVKRWQDNDDFAGAGTAMRFVHQGQGAIRLGHIRVSEWDGQLDETTTNAPDAKLDLVRLRNGDKVSGAVQSVHDGKVQISNSTSKLEIPLMRVKQLNFATEKMERAKVAPDDVRAFFPHGESITFHLDRWDEHEVVGTSANFGKVKFNPAAFARIQFDAKGAQ